MASITQIKELTRERDPQRVFAPRHFQTAQLPNVTSAIADRVPLLFNDDVAISYAHAVNAEAWSSPNESEPSRADQR